MNETFIPASDYTKKKWYVIDCKDKQLGRISSSILDYYLEKLSLIITLLLILVIMLF